MLWTHASAVVPPFTGSDRGRPAGAVHLRLQRGATKYFDALEEGEIPLCFLFSGTIFYEAEDGPCRSRRSPWEKEAYFRLPVAVWQEMMEHYYPNSAWLCLRKDVFDRLYQLQEPAAACRPGSRRWRRAC